MDSVISSFTKPTPEKDNTDSIDMSTGKRGRSTLAAVATQSSAVSPESWIQETNFIGRLEEWLHAIPEIHREILCYRFGISGYKLSTLQHVGDSIGLTQEQVKQHQIEALSMLRKIIASNGLESVDYDLLAT